MPRQDAKLRVLHVYSGNLYGGVETLLLTLAQTAFLCPRMVLEFALCFDARLSRELSEMEPPHLLGDVRLRYPWTWAKARLRLRQLLEARSYDTVVCHAPWCLTIFGPVVRSMGIALVFSVHDATSGRHWIERLARRTVPDLVLCNSHFTTATLKNQYPGVPTRHIYWPVKQQSKIATSKRSALRSDFRTPDSDVVIIQVSRLERWKGHVLHLEALSRLAGVPNWSCWFVGGPQKAIEHAYLAELESLAARLGIAARIRFLGQRSDVPALLAAADIHCQPNVGPEPFGRTFIEGLAAGLPVVTTSIGAAVEIVDPSCGILVPPNDPGALSAALEKLVWHNDLRVELGTVGRERAQHLCDPQRQLNNILEILGSVVARKQAA